MEQGKKRQPLQRLSGESSIIGTCRHYYQLLSNGNHGIFIPHWVKMDATNNGNGAYSF